MKLDHQYERRLIGSMVKNTAAAVALLLCLNGCGIFSTLTQTTRRIVREAAEQGAHLQKTVAIAAFGYGISPSKHSLEKRMQASLSERMQTRCPSVYLVSSKDAAHRDLLVSLPRYATGTINNFQLAEKGREKGFNAVIVGQSVDIHEDVEEKGLLWFKDTHRYARINVMIDVYDTATGTKLVGGSHIRKIDVNDDGLSRIKSGDYNVPAIDDALLDISDRAAEEICAEMQIQRWNAYILASDKTGVTLSAGSRAGLTVGDILEVYSNTETISGTGGQRFYLPPKKVGEVRIASLASDQAKARRVSGDEMAPGDLVFFKQVR